MSAIAAVTEVATGRRPALPESREKLRLSRKIAPLIADNTRYIR
jgi:hypothetical protein